MIKCIIIEDEPLARTLLEQYLKKVSNFELLGSFENPLLALDFLRQQNVDVIFCDIEMPDLTGIDFLKVLQKKPIIILTTAYSEYAVDAFTIGVSDYLLKPITFERFMLSIERINDLLDAKTDKTDETEKIIFIKEGQKTHKINLDELLYIKSSGDYITLFFKDKKMTIYERLKNILLQLPQNQFIRIHNSYIVNINHVESMDKNAALIDSTSLPISDTYKVAIKVYFEN